MASIKETPDGIFIYPNGFEDPDLNPIKIEIRSMVYAHLFREHRFHIRRVE